MNKKLKKIVPMFSLVSSVYAQDNSISLGAPDGFTQLSGMTIGKLITTGISYLLIIASVVFFFIFVFGGIKWITSGGDEKKVAAARSSITNALIGLAVVFSAWAIMKLIDSIFNTSISGSLNAI